MTDHRICCPELFPPDDWQDTYPGEFWSSWYFRTYGSPWMGFLSSCGWPMEGMSYGRCINPHCPDRK